MPLSTQQKNRTNFCSSFNAKDLTEIFCQVFFCCNLQSFDFFWYLYAYSLKILVNIEVFSVA